MLSWEIFFWNSAAITPYNFVKEITALRTEDPVQYKFQVMAGGGIAMQIEAARWLQHPMNLRDSPRHANQVRQQASIFQNTTKPLYESYRLRRVPAFSLPMISRKSSSA